MANPIAERRELLTNLCRHYQVHKLEVFGSAADGSFDPRRSDVDFLVEFLPLDPKAHADAYFGLWFALKDLFGREVDLVETAAIHNRYFLKRINEQRQVLYAA